MATTPHDVLQRFEQLNAADEGEERDHSLRENALRRAQQPLDIQAGTAYDWEELDAYARELERLDREGPGLRPKTDAAP